MALERLVAETRALLAAARARGEVAKADAGDALMDRLEREGGAAVLAESAAFATRYGRATCATCPTCGKIR